MNLIKVSTFVCTAVLMVAGAPVAQAQSSGAVRVTVVDSTGGAVEGAAITLSRAGGTPLPGATSDTKGTVAFTAVEPGVYLIRAERTLFVPWQQTITVNPGPEPTPVSIVLQVEGLAERVSVMARETTSGALGERALLDSPFSVNVVSSEWLANQQAHLMLEALRGDPSVVAGFGAGYSSYQTISLRGLALSFNSNFRRNGLPFIRFSETPYEDVEQVEVLKGLSGFLYGFATPGGIINIVPKQPTEQRFASLRTGFTGNALWLGHLDLGGRLGPSRQFGYRLNFVREQGETSIDGAEVGRTLASANLDWRIGSRVTLGLDVESHTIRPTGQPLYYSLAAGLPVPSPPKLDRFNGVSYATYDTDDLMVGLNGTWTVRPGWTVVARFLDHSHERDAWFSSGAVTGSSGAMTVAVQRDLEQAFPARSGSVLMQGQVRTGRFTHDVSVGVNWNTNESYRGDFVFAPRYPSNLYEPVEAPASSLTSVRPQYQNASYDERAAVVSDVVSITPRVQIMAGARWAELDQRNFLFTGAQSTRYEKAAVSPSAALIVKPRPSMSLYVTGSGGLEQGGIAGLTTVNAGEVFGPLRSQQVEAGLKWEIRPQLAVAAAYFDIDKGLTYIDPATNRFVQDGRQSHRGLEATIDGRVGDGLTLAGGVMILDATASRTGNPLVDGNRPVNVPGATATLVGDYTLPRWSQFALNAGVQFVGERDVDVINARTIDGYTLVNAGARFEWLLARRPAVARVSVDNLTNRQYWAAATPTLHAGLARTLKATLQLDF